MSKTRRKAYTGSKAVDKSCRGKRGSCPTCSENRQYKNTKLITKNQYYDEKCRIYRSTL